MCNCTFVKLCSWYHSLSTQTLPIWSCGMTDLFHTRKVECTRAFETQCRCQTVRVFFLGLHHLSAHCRSIFIGQRFTGDGEGAVDVVMVVDESKSMDEEHAWIAGMVNDLEMTLKSFGIGVSPLLPNLFGIIGFGRGESAHPNGYLAHTFTSHDGREMLPINDFVQVSMLLKADVDGSVEDGYQAIEHALNTIDFRTNQNIGRVMILISDEDRDNTPQGKSLSRERIRSHLMEKQMALHVIVDNTFEANGTTALGVNSTGWAFLQGDKGIVTNAPGAQLGRGYAETRRDYTELALEVNGTAWDNNLVQKGGETTQALTSAFTRFVASNTYELGANCKRCGYQSGTSNYRCLQVNCLVSMGETWKARMFKYSRQFFTCCPGHIEQKKVRFPEVEMRE